MPAGSKKIDLSGGKSKTKGGAKSKGTNTGGGGAKGGVAKAKAKAKGATTASKYRYVGEAPTAEPSYKTTAADRDERLAARRRAGGGGDGEKFFHNNVESVMGKAKPKTSAKSADQTKKGMSGDGGGGGSSLIQASLSKKIAIGERNNRELKQKEETLFYNHFLVHTLFRETERIDEELRLNGCLVRANSGLHSVVASDHRGLGDRGKEPRYPIYMLSDRTFRSALAALAGARQVYENQNKRINDFQFGTTLREELATGGESLQEQENAVVDLRLSQEDVALLTATTRCFNEAIPMTNNFQDPVVAARAHQQQQTLSAERDRNESVIIMTQCDIHYRFRLLSMIQGTRLYLRAPEEHFSIPHDLLRGCASCIDLGEEEDHQAGGGGAAVWGSSIKKILSPTNALRETRSRLQKVLLTIAKKLNLVQAVPISDRLASTVTDVVPAFHSGSCKGIFVTRANQERSRFLSMILQRKMRVEGLPMFLRASKMVMSSATAEHHHHHGDTSSKGSSSVAGSYAHVLADSGLSLDISLDLLPKDEYRIPAERDRREKIQSELKTLVNQYSESVEIKLGRRPHLAAALLSGKVFPEVSSLQELQAFNKALNNNKAASGAGIDNTSASSSQLESVCGPFATVYPWCSEFSAVFMIPNDQGAHSEIPYVGYLAAVVTTTESN